MVLLALLCSLAAVAQTRGAKHLVSSAPTVPPYCSPCLFYSGDFDPNNPKANALGNGVMLIDGVGPGAVYVPFVVPSGEAWSVRSLFINELATVEVLDPATAPWSVSTGVSAGNPGTVVASGLGSATLTPTGRSFNGMAEFTVVDQVREFQLQPGTYWLSVLPQCTNRGDPSCGQAEYFATNVEDRPSQNAKGVSPWDDSFFTYPHGNEYYISTWEYPISCCDRFSGGLVGVATKTGE